MRAVRYRAGPAALAFVLLAGCGGGETRVESDGGACPDLPACSLAFPECAAPPERPPQHYIETEPTTIAIRRVHFRGAGYDLDGLVSRAGDCRHCALVPDADPARVVTDGEGGVDNSFGANVVPLLEELAPGVETRENDAIAAGRFTLLFTLDSIDDPDGTPDQWTTAALYGGADRGAPPVFDGTDVWPISGAALATFPDSYVADGTWVSGSLGDVELPLALPGGVQLRLPIRHAGFSMRVHGSQASASADHGVISGVVPLADLASALRASADASSCDAYDSLIEQLRQMSDVMSDRTNGDPGRTCDAISIGVGFEGSAVIPGGVVAPDPAPPDPCAGL